MRFQRPPLQQKNFIEYLLSKRTFSILWFSKLWNWRETLTGTEWKERMINLERFEWNIHFFHIVYGVFVTMKPVIHNSTINFMKSNFAKYQKMFRMDFSFWTCFIKYNQFYNLWIISHSCSIYYTDLLA